MSLPPSAIASLHWLADMGVDRITDLNPCVPGQFTLADAYYVNTGTPGVIYLGTEEGTLPMLSGRWFLIPGTVLDRAPQLRREPLPVARAVRLSRG